MKTNRLAAFGALLILGVSLFSAVSSPAVRALDSAGTQTSGITQQVLQDIAGATTLAQVKTATDTFLNQYNMVLSFDCPAEAAGLGDECTSVGPADFSLAQYDALQLVEELSKLPTDIMQGFDQHTYYFVHSFALPGGHSANVFDYRFGGPLMGVAKEIRGTLLHEFYHFYQYYKTGSNYADDPDWTANNPGGFTYGSGSCEADDPSCTPPARPAGFATPYAPASIAEDKAETFASLFETTRYPDLLNYAQSDSLLAGKVNLMKSFFAGIDSSMDENYYAAIHAYANTNYDLPTLNQITGTQQITGTHKHAYYVVNDQASLVADGELGDITVASGGTVKGTGQVVNSLYVSPGAYVAPGHSPGCLTVADLTEGGTYQAEIGGNTACSQYDQIITTNSVTLVDSSTQGGKDGSGEGTNGILYVSLYGGFVPSVGNTFKIIDNQSGSPVSGTFNGLAEGSSFTQNGITYSITYAGGDGNDVVLTVTSVDPSLTPTSQQAPAAPDTGFGLITSNPVFVAAVTVTCSSLLVYAARQKHFI